MNTQRLAVLATLLLCLPVAAAEPPDPEFQKRLALDYMETLAAADWQKQSTFYSTESVFEDPTADYFGEPWHFQGPEAISEFWRRSYEGSGTLEVRNEYRHIFVTGSRVVIEFDSHVRLDAVQLGFPGQEVECSIHVVTVLTFEDGKILHHLDHADYAGAYRQMDTLKQELTTQQQKKVKKIPSP